MPTCPTVRLIRDPEKKTRSPIRRSRDERIRAPTKDIASVVRGKWMPFSSNTFATKSEQSRGVFRFVFSSGRYDLAVRIMDLAKGEGGSECLRERAGAEPRQPQIAIANKSIPTLANRRILAPKPPPVAPDLDFETDSLPMLLAEKRRVID